MSRAFTPADIARIFGVLEKQLDRYRRPARWARCKRVGHTPAARWRGMQLRCFRCTRCGEETKP